MIEGQYLGDSGFMQNGVYWYLWRILGRWAST